MTPSNADCTPSTITPSLLPQKVATFCGGLADTYLSKIKSLDAAYAAFPFPKSCVFRVTARPVSLLTKTLKADAIRYKKSTKQSGSEKRTKSPTYFGPLRNGLPVITTLQIGPTKLVRTGSVKRSR